MRSPPLACLLLPFAHNRASEHCFGAFKSLYLMPLAPNYPLDTNARHAQCHQHCNRYLRLFLQRQRPRHCLPAVAAAAVASTTTSDNKT